MEKLLSPFVRYWNWAQERASPLTKTLAMGAPLLVFGLVLYLVFGRGGDDASSLTPDIGSNGENVAADTTQPPVTMATQPPSGEPTGGQQTNGNGAAPEATEAGGTTEANGEGDPAPTAFTQQRYEVAPGDTPGAIAEKVGVPAEIRPDWIREMLALNGVSATTLQVGQELILPPF